MVSKLDELEKMQDDIIQENDRINKNIEKQGIPNNSRKRNDLSLSATKNPSIKQD